MNNRYIIFSIAFLLHSIVLAENSKVAPHISIDPFKNSHFEGCGCGFAKAESPSEGIFFIDTSSSGKAWIKVDGKEQEVNPNGPKVTKKGKDGVIHEVSGFQNDEIKVEIDNVVIFKGEESESYNTTLRVKKGKARLTIAAKGACGC